MLLEKIREIEKDARLLDYKFEAYGLPMWILIRYAILSGVERLIFGASSYSYRNDNYVSQRTKLKYYVKSAVKTPFCYNQKDILFLYSTGSETLNSDNKFENRTFGDLFLSAEEKSIIVQSAYNNAYKMPSIDKNICCEDIIKLLIDRDKDEVSQRDLKEIDRLIEFVKESLNVTLDDKIFINAKNSLMYYAPRIKSAIKHYGRLYESIAPKLVFIEDAHYLGGYGALKIFAAKQKGIKVAEFQHGITCCPYWFGPAIYEDKRILNYIPDFLLIYGDYWRKYINTPALCVTVGNPNFYKKAKINFKAPENTILVLQDFYAGHSKKSAFDCAAELAKSLPDYKITYRFHPIAKSKSEETIKNVEKSGSLRNFTIDTNADIYESLHENEHIVGTESTALYEAACLGRRVYLIKNEFSQIFFGSDEFVFFDSPGQLVKIISGGESKTNNDETREFIFKSNFWEDYLRFLGGIGIKTGASKNV